MFGQRIVEICHHTAPQAVLSPHFWERLPFKDWRCGEVLRVVFNNGGCAYREAPLEFPRGLDEISFHLWWLQRKVRRGD